MEFRSALPAALGVLLGFASAGCGMDGGACDAGDVGERVSRPKESTCVDMCDMIFGDEYCSHHDYTGRPRLILGQNLIFAGDCGRFCAQGIFDSSEVQCFWDRPSCSESYWATCLDATN